MKKYNFLITIVGRSNVGKSSLFNKLTNEDYSLVSNKPGLTIDRKYGYFFIKNKKIGIIDTGSIIDHPEIKLYEKILYQSKISIEESDFIFFIIDGNLGILNEDYEVFNFIKKFNKPILLIINKIDISNNYKSINFKYFNVKNILYISVKNNIGIQKLHKFILNKYKLNININNSIYIKENNNYVNKISIIGKQNVGKSTLINNILNENRMVVSDVPGTTKDSINLNINLNKIDYIITDTAGITNLKIFISKKKIVNKISNEIDIKIINNIKKSNIIILIIDIIIGLTNKDLLIINFLIKEGKPIILLFNKCDLLSKNDLKIKKQIFYNKLNFAKYLNIYFISALKRFGVNLLFKSIKNIQILLNKKLKTNLLNKILFDAVKLNNIIDNKKIKLKFCNIIEYYPIKIIIYGKKLNLLNNSYKKYLINFFIKNIGYKNIPISIYFKEN